MSVQQTSQLIQLILNSALMITICVGLMGGLWLRHNAITKQLQSLKNQILKFSHSANGSVPEQFTQLRHKRLHLQRRYRLIHSSTLVIHYALMVFVASLFALALRTLLNLSWLVPIALFLFIVGAGGVLVSVAFALLDFYQFNQSASGKSGWTLDPKRTSPSRTRRKPSIQPSTPSLRGAIASETSLKTGAI